MTLTASTRQRRILAAAAARCRGDGWEPATNARRSGATAPAPRPAHPARRPRAGTHSGGGTP